MSVLITPSVYDRVRDSYSFRAENPVTPGLRARIAAAWGYDPLELAAVPDAANTGESCGNPLTMANLAKGETVVDLGSGGGLDVFLAAKKVGPSGKAIGIDMTEKMLELARRNAAEAGLTNVEFLFSKIDSIPLPSATVDCILSNCVLNLVPEEDRFKVFQEMHRILKPGGRIAISDFLAYKALPQEIKDDPELFAGCVSGAIEVSKMENILKESGFDHILLVDTKRDLNLYKDTEESAPVTPCCSSTSTSCNPRAASGRKELDYDLREWIGSFQVFAIKDGGPSTVSIVDSAKDVPPEISGTTKGTRRCCGV